MSTEHSTSGFLIFNASSGKGEKFTLEEVLSQLPLGTQFHKFANGDDLVALTKKSVANGATWVAVAGGDGTVEAVAEALVHTDVPLGIIPNGTYNNFSRSANIPNDTLKAAALIGKGVTRWVDVGFINKRIFLECVGIGLDAAIFPESEKIKSGGIMSCFALVKKAFKYKRQLFDIELNQPFRDALMGNETTARSAKQWQKCLKSNHSHCIRLRALMLTVSNGPYYGMNFAVAPAARIDDGFLTLSIFKKYSKLELARHFWSLWLGQQVYAPQIWRLNVSKVRIGGPIPAKVHRDGTILNEWPLDLSLHSKALRIFGPEPSQKRLEQP